jgi:hypothetical protein
MKAESQIEIVVSVLVIGLSTALASGYLQLSDEILSSPLLAIIIVIVAFMAFAEFPMVGLSLFFLLAILLFSRNVKTTISSSQRPPRNLDYIPLAPQQLSSPPVPPPIPAPVPRTFVPIQTPSRESPKLVVSETLHTDVTLPPLPKRARATVETHPLTERPEVLHTGDTTYGQVSIQNTHIPIAHPYSTVHSQPRDMTQFNETDRKNPVLGSIVEGFLPANIGKEVGAPVEGQYPIHERRSSSSPDTRDYNYHPSPTIGSNDFEKVSGPDLDEKLNNLNY